MSKRLKDLLATGKPVWSFEVFPPKTPAGLESMYGAVDRLMTFKPVYFSCTYGAGGSTQGPTLDICTEIMRRHQVATMAHLTCVGLTVDSLRDFLRQARERGIQNIMALRGDPPKGQEGFQKIEGGLGYASDLVGLIRSEFPEMGIGVGGYPETHQEATSPEDDLRHLKTKVDAGADAVVCQLFYNNDDYFRFVDRCHQINIRIPLVPGLLPIVNFPQIQRITALCGAKLPDSLYAELEKHQNDPAATAEIGADHARRQTEGLIQKGAPGVHFYVLNQSEAAYQALKGLGVA
ncbi:MAG: methylenetetrahydrofolate reductase [NAD(P)H] [Planctomycetota bacterium]|nr:methylenetetrahydrofolate reductase [NAD(P)H] [Planctomycetota bacterium]